MAQLITVRLSKSDQQPLGFRLQGGKDFGTPLVVQKVNGGSAAERAGLQAGDALIRVNSTDVYTLRHQEAQDTIRAAGPALELTVQRGGGTWRPSVTPTGSLPRPGSRLGATPTPVTSTSLKATPQPSRAFGSGHNNVAKPFGYMNGSDSVKSIVNKQYNTPVNMYSDKTIAETLSAQTEVLAGGVLGVNFKKNEKTYDAEKSAVFKVLQEAENDPEPVESAVSAPPPPGLRPVQAPAPRADAPPNTGGLPPGQNICEECERLITGVFVRIKDKNLHVECFKCSTCGSSLKNQGYYNLNGKLYCDIHAKLVARNNPPAPNLEPVTVPPGGRLPSNYSTPLPPLSTNNYTNGSSSLFSPSSNLSGPKPFGSSIGSAYSPSLSPRSAPLSPAARPLAAPAPAPAPAHAPAPATQPFAPTQSVKSIVWPPPNPPDDELPKPKPDPICGREKTQPTDYEKSQQPVHTEHNQPAMQIEQTLPSARYEQTQPSIRYEQTQSSTRSEETHPAVGSEQAQPARREVCQRAAAPVSLPEMFSNAQQIAEQQLLSLSQQTKEHTSSVSYASATISSSTATSSKSESIVHSQQSQEKRETTSHVVKSFSEQASAESQSVMIYQSQTSPPVQKSFENPMDKISQTQIKEKSEAQIIMTSEMKEEKKVAQESISSSTAPEKAQDPKIESQINTQNQIDDQAVLENKESNDQSQNAQNKVETIHPNANIEPPKSNSNAQDIAIHKQPDNPVSKVEDTMISKTKLSHTENVNETVVAKEVIKEVVEEQVLRGDSVPVKQSIIEPNLGPYASMVEALTIAPDRPYSPLPSAPLQPSDINPQPTQSYVKPQEPMPVQEDTKPNPPPSMETHEVQLTSQPSPMFSQQPKRGITPVPPIKPYNPPESRQAPIPMPAETKPYIPPDFKIKIEPKVVPREGASSPMVDALTTAPERPFTPGPPQQPIERGSLREALTIAPDRPYSPLPLHMTSQSSHYTSTSTVQVQSTSSEIIRPIATQTTTQLTDQIHSEFSSMQNTYKLQSSSDMSAFRPVAKQVFPPPQPEEFCKLAQFPPLSDELKTSFEKSTRSKHEMMISESKFAQQSVVTTASSMSTQGFSSSQGFSSTQGFSSVKNAQQFFEHLDQKESLTSTAVRSKSGLQKADKIPTYQKNFEQLPSQRGITPEICLAPAIPQRPVTPTTEPPTKPRDKSQEPKSFNMPIEMPTQRIPQVKTPVQQSHVQFQKNTPISMTFQPVADEHFLRASPARSRPTTPSLINKPAPIIPHYQMNLVTVEHIAPETHLYDPSSRENSRSPTPKLRSRSPAQGPPPNPLKAQAPRLKETTPQRHTQAHTLLTQATSNLRKEHEMAQKDFYLSNEGFNINPSKNWVQEPSIVREQKHSNVGFKSECYNKQDMSIKEDSMINQNFGQRQMQSQNVAEYGNTTVQTTRKTFEEFERTQSAKVIEIRKGGLSSSTGYQQIDSNIRPSSINPKQVFPPPIMSMPPSQKSSSYNHTNDNVTNASRSIEISQPKPSISGANQGPVCDPTPSTGSSVGAATRGKTFGVSSAPKRGRGVLNKAALPGSRVPLCASCNGNISNTNDVELTNGDEQKDDRESETFVRRRQKKNVRNDDGRRDSHIIARPLSTMTSVDVTDGMYPVCHKCDKAITRGPFITALGRIWCPEHFICVNATCRRPLQDIGFVEENGQLYCEYCFEQYIAPACDKCHAKIKGDCLNAIGKHFHPECFNCVYCGKLFGNNPFFLEDGLPYCEADWNELFTTKCFSCGFPVEAGDRWVEALNNNYHSQCFNCTVCKKNLEGQSFFAKGGRPFCKMHAR